MKKFSHGKLGKYSRKFEDIPLSMFKDGWDKIKLPSFPADGSKENLAELKILKKKILSNSEEDLERIADQDSATKAFEIHFANIIKKPTEKDFILKLASEVFKIVIYYKNKYDRPRPWQMAKHFKFDYPNFESQTADSPSFPSGHAAGAHFIANVLGEKYPKYKQQLKDYADDVSENRMKGGVHYPSDIRAGKFLANALMKFYKPLNKMSFKEWFN